MVLSSNEFIYTTACFILVAVLWGSTNPLIKRGSEGLDKITRKYQHRSWLFNIIAQTWFLFTKWQYVVPLVLNLSGSIVYYYTLSTADLSLAVPITNSLTFIFTGLTGKLLGEDIGGLNTWLGMSMVVFGVGLCVTSRV